MSSAVAAFFYATPWCLSDAVGVDDLVDHHGPGFNAFRNPSSPADVFRPHAGGQTKDAVIRELDGFVVSFESHHRQHGAKSFIPHDSHVVIDVREHGGFVKQAVEIRS